MENKTFIGQMDRKIQLVQKLKTQTATGSEISSEVVVSQPFAAMKDLSGGEEVDGKVIHLISRTYTIWFNPVIKEKGTALILIDEGRKFEVIHIVELGRKQYLEIRVKSYE
jgi:head-tail adaptor